MDYIKFGLDRSVSRVSVLLSLFCLSASIAGDGGLRDNCRVTKIKVACLVRLDLIVLLNLNYSEYGNETFLVAYMQIM